MLRTPSGARLASASQGGRARAPRPRVVVLAASADGAPPPAGGRWSPRRFLQQLTWFNPPARMLRGLLSTLTGGGGSGDAPATGVVVVTGATGGVGKRVVARLLAAGRPVRAVVRNPAKAASLLGGLPKAPGASLEIVAADLAQAKTLPPTLSTGVAAVVSAHAVVVTPAEGDDVDRSKYYQGIKFYDPTIADDSPQAVECGGMANLLAALAPALGERAAGASAGVSLFDPASNAALVTEFGSLDDVVMGGASASEFRVVEGAGEAGAPGGVFLGTLTEAGGGGFASVRTRNFEPPLDAGGCAGLSLRVLGDGRRYKAILRNEAGWDSPTQCASFDTVAGEWQTVALPWAAFKPVFRAKTVRGGPAVDPSKLVSLQIMLSKFEYDGALNPTHRVGEFRLPIAKVWCPAAAGGGAPPAPATAPLWVHVSSAGVTRPSRPGIDVDVEPPAVKMNAALGGILDWKLAAEDALRSSGVPFAIVRPVALTEEPAGMPVELDQGDTIKGKLSRDDAADLCVALLSTPAATGVTFEVKSTVPFSQPWEGPPAGTPPRDWRATVAAAGLVPGVTGKTVDGVYTGKQVEKAAARAG